MARRPSTNASPGKARDPRFVSDEVPLYYQLASLLREQIITGAYAPGDRIPTEADLIQEYGLSRITVRQALRSLGEQGLIRPEPGRGTFVSKPPPFVGRLALDGTIEDLISMGLSTSVKLLDIGEVSATSSDAALLRVDPGVPLTRVTRVRFYDREPYSFIVNLLPAETGRRITRRYLKRGSMLVFLEKKLGIHLYDATQSVRATLADPEHARWLRTRIGAPLLFVDRVVRTDNGRPVMRTMTYYRSDIYSFSIHLTRDPHRAETPHAGWALKDRKAAR